MEVIAVSVRPSYSLSIQIRRYTAPRTDSHRLTQINIYLVPTHRSQAESFEEAQYQQFLLDLCDHFFWLDSTGVRSDGWHT
jgi:hypothetical protein